MELPNLGAQNFLGIGSARLPWDEVHEFKVGIDVCVVHEAAEVHNFVFWGSGALGFRGCIAPPPQTTAAVRGGLRLI